MKLKHSSAICVFLVLLLSLAQAINNRFVLLFVLLGYLIYVAYTVDRTPALILPVFLFFLPWSAVIKLSSSSISFYSLAFLVAYAVFLLKGKTGLFRSMLFPLLSLVGITLLSKLVHGYGISTAYIMFFVTMISLFGFVREYREVISFPKCAWYYSLGIVSAAVMSLLLQNNVYVQAYVKVLQQEHIGVTRFCGFYQDPNFFAAQFVVAIGAWLLIFLKEKKADFPSVLMVVLLTALGMTSLSKAYILSVILVFAASLLLSLRDKKGAGNIAKVGAMLVLLVSVILWTGVLDEQISEYFIRFSMSTDTGTLTTGRSGLWKEYLTMFWENPAEFLLGQGITSVFNRVPKGSHNTFIQLVYQFGFFGMITFGCWLVCFAKAMRPSSAVRKGVFGNTLFLIVAFFVMWLGLDELFFDDFWLVIAWFMVAFRYIREEPEKGAWVA